MTTAYINRVATAVPPYDIHDAFRKFAQSLFKDRRNAVLFRRMADKADIEHRYSSLSPSNRPEGEAVDAQRFYVRGDFPDTAMRMQRFEQDAPALAQADVGMAIGSGTDVAKETGDVILIKDDIRDVVVALEVGKATMRKVKQNLFWAFIYNSLGIPLAAGLFYPFAAVVISPELAGLMMAVSSITVTLNTLLLKGFRPSVRSGDTPRGKGTTQPQLLTPAQASAD